MNQEHLINNIKTKLSFESAIYVKPNIPSKKITNALGSYGRAFMPDDVIVLLDDTLFGSAKDGLMITKNLLAIKAFLESPQYFRLDSIKQISFTNKKIVINNAQVCHFTTSEKSIEMLVKIISEALSLDTPNSTSSVSITNSTKNSVKINPSDYGIPNAKYSDCFLLGYQPYFKQSLEHDDELPNELKIFYQKVYAVVLNLNHSHRNHIKFKAELAPIYESDEAMCFMLLWAVFCIVNIMKNNGFEEPVIDSITLILYNTIELLVKYMDDEHFDTLSAKANPQKAFETSKVMNLVTEWRTLMQANLRGVEDGLDDNLLYSIIPTIFFLDLRKIYPKISNYVEDAGVDLDSENGHMLFFRDFTQDVRKKMELYLNQLF